MHSVLLLGAGFSRNWGGWLATECFEYLLGCPQVDPELRDLLWNHRRTDGFEGALADLQKEHFKKKDTRSEQRLRKLRCHNANVRRHGEGVCEGQVRVSK